MPKWNQIFGKIILLYIIKMIYYYNYYNISLKDFKDKRQRGILKLNKVGFDFMLL